MTYRRRKDVTPQGTQLALRHRWAVLGARGAVQCVLNEYLPGEPLHEIFGGFSTARRTGDGHVWDAVDVGYHSPRPMHDDHEPRECDLLEGDCWYGGSTPQAQYLLATAMVNGEIADAVIWFHLERYYVEMFER